MTDSEYFSRSVKTHGTQTSALLTNDVSSQSYKQRAMEVGIFWKFGYFYLISSFADSNGCYREGSTEEMQRRGIQLVDDIWKS